MDKFIDSSDKEDISEERFLVLLYVFQLFDMDNDRTITAIELGNILRKLGYKPK